jgi:cAMP-binding proteins - catabolite gene activator and regulatory subunit of cAMP-dependent protein kinases
MSDSLAILGRHPYFAGLPPKILAAVRGRVITKRYKKGAVIYAEGEASPGLYLVESGTVRIYKGSPDGREQDLHRVGAGQSFNDAAALDGAATVATAEAREPAVVQLVPRDALRDLILRHPEIGLSVSHVLAERVRELSALVGELSLQHVVSRLAAFVLRSADARSVVVLPTRQDLAGQIGTVREVAARGLRHLEQLGCIRIESGRRAIVLDRRMLDRLVKNPRPARAALGQ